jgi:plastocyanin
MRLGLALAAAILATAAPALADDNDIMQIRQSFDPSSADIAVGTTLNFVNADDVNHNLILVNPDGSQVDNGLERPGETTAIAFKTVGGYSVICHIHPRMKIKINVHG